MGHIRPLSMALSAAALWALSGTANAIAINQCQTGACGGDVTVATLTVTQEDSDTVRFSLANSVANLSNATRATFISYFRFNYTGDASTLAFTTPTATTGFVGPSTVRSVSGTRTDAGLAFDVSLNLPTAGNNGGTRRFTNGEVVAWTASVSSGLLSVNDFTSPMLAHIQALTGGASSKYISAPAPAVAALLGLGLIGFAVAGRLKKTSGRGS